MSTFRLAVDVGGTFTDIFVLDEETSDVRIAKVPSTPHDPLEGVIAGIRAAAVALNEVSVFSHGTTVATNALITRTFPKVAMVTTKGFRDVLEIRRGTKDDLWDAYKDVSPPYIARRDRHEVAERVDFSGAILEQLDEDGARELAVILRRRGAEAVAVCFINSYANPANERRMKEILEQELPDVTVTASSEVVPEIFEYERFSTTVTNAVLSPLVVGYVTRLGDELRAGGYEGDLLLLHSGGGVMSGKLADRYAVRLAGSGIAAGAIAARHLAQLCGYENAIGLDMGGTSTDISLIYGGEMRTSNEWSVDYGHPIMFPSIEILTIGAGGGSLAWIDDAGALRNGPQSAGADPGPACYGRGGEDPTNTDANLVLGRLGGQLAGGAMTLDADAARAALRRTVADPLGMEVTEAASAVVEVANANMADAVRLISIGRGYDPRDFALVVFGGAGALHGAALAKELSIPRVIVPPNPGITSALGCLLVDIRHDLSTMFLRAADSVDVGEVEGEFRKLEAEARKLLKAERVPAEQMTLVRTISMRYVGQWRSLSVEVGAELSSLDAAIARFNEEHQREFSYSREDAPVEIYQLSVRAVGITPKPKLSRAASGDSATPQAIATRRVYFDDTQSAIDTPIYERSILRAGASITGPAIVEQLDSTVLVPPDVRAEVDEWQIIHMHISEP